MKSYLQKSFPQLDIKKIRINKSVVSLNSTNGFLQTPNQEYFFKFHTEEDETKSLAETEYYQAQVLAEAGLPTIQPLYTNSTPGSQCLIYPKITAPTAFEEFEKAEQNLTNPEPLLQAESQLLTIQSQVMLKTLTTMPSPEAEKLPINQLFYNRLVSLNKSTPRLNLYYTSNPFFQKIAKLKWIINDIPYPKTLEEIIETATKTLNPKSTTPVPVVLGHGDDHNGNKFYINKKFYLFDPAFAGYQPALLSFIKATAHNVFAHPFWLYNPEKILTTPQIRCQITNNKIYINYNWPLTSLRQKILALQNQKIWQPLLSELKSRNLLSKNYQQYIQSALFCCPFLVTNLLNRPANPQILFALSKCIELTNFTL